ncbi:helix-turn-helix transcriptional regulator [Jannaschia formosa]|uniref:helix-turn-helix transcriptional regulator n=1 Tax=Jannaschia formosa TaxID=2259592 RepID=UPI000E1C04F5|nr:YafY family protein [Jannaschia formosa]TFL18546.1 YafY family transcriptional regulator [Jannaschia formosa]
MRRADRLFRLVQILRGGRLWTAARLASEMEVSERTIYRDIADLMASGVPIEGAAGVGYVMRQGYDLPPLMLTEEEVTALALGAHMAIAWGGTEMAASARLALSKIESVLPRPDQMAAAVRRIGMPGRFVPEEVAAHLDILDDLIRRRRVAVLVYEDARGEASARRVRPLALWFWGRNWTLIAWCELREDFRMFRLDRITGVSDTGAGFAEHPDRSLRAFLALGEAEGHRLPAGPLG